jgi:hypothetical protein
MTYKKTRKLKKLFNARKNKHKKYTKRGGTPKLQRLNASKKNVDSILERIKKNQDASRENMQKMFRYIQGKSQPQYDLGQAEHPDPVYDIGQANSSSPLYDLGQAKSGSPVYDLGQAEHPDPVYDIGQAKSGSPVYDLGQAKSGSPIYDMGQANPSQEVFAKIIKNLEDKSKEYNRDELIKLTPENVHQYIGYNILFGTRNNYIVKKILGVSKTGKSIQIEHPDLQNSLEIVSRNVYVIVKKSPLYDIGQADAEPDLKQTDSSKNTFISIVKRTLDKNNIYTRDDLIKFCNGSDRTKIYDAVLKECPPKKCEGKNFKAIVRKSYEELLSGFKIHKESKV